MGVRSFLIKFCCLVCLFGFLFLAGLDPHLMSARRGQRAAAAAAERELKRAHCHANEAAGSGHSSSGSQGQDPIVDSTSQSSQEFPATSAPASSPHHQGTEARKVKRVRCGKRKICGCEAGYERREAEAHLGSPSVHQSGMSSDDLFGEDEVEELGV